MHPSFYGQPEQRPKLPGTKIDTPDGNNPLIKVVTSVEGDAPKPTTGPLQAPPGTSPKHAGPLESTRRKTLEAMDEQGHRYFPPEEMIPKENSKNVDNSPLNEEGAGATEHGGRTNGNHNANDGGHNCNHNANNGPANGNPATNDGNPNANGYETDWLGDPDYILRRHCEERNWWQGRCVGNNGENAFSRPYGPVYDAPDGPPDGNRNVNNGGNNGITNGNGSNTGDSGSETSENGDNRRNDNRNNDDEAEGEPPSGDPGNGGNRGGGDPPRRNNNGNGDPGNGGDDGNDNGGGPPRRNNNNGNGNPGNNNPNNRGQGPPNNDNGDDGSDGGHPPSHNGGDGGGESPSSSSSSSDSEDEPVDPDRSVFNGYSSSRRFQLLSDPVSRDITEHFRRPKIVTDTSLVRLRATRQPPEIQLANKKPFDHKKAPVYETSRAYDMCILEFLTNQYAVFLAGAGLKTHYDHLKCYYFALPQPFRPMWLKFFEKSNEEKCNRKGKRYIIKFVSKFVEAHLTRYVWTRQRWRDHLPNTTFKHDDTIESYLDKLHYCAQKSYTSINSIPNLQTLISIIWKNIPPGFKNAIITHPDFDNYKGINPSVEYEDFVLKLKRHYSLFSDMKALKEFESKRLENKNVIRSVQKDPESRVRFMNNRGYRNQPRNSDRNQFESRRKEGQSSSKAMPREPYQKQSFGPYPRRSMSQRRNVDPYPRNDVDYSESREFFNNRHNVNAAEFKKIWENAQYEPRFRDRTTPRMQKYDILNEVATRLYGEKMKKYNNFNITTSQPTKESYPDLKKSENSAKNPDPSRDPKYNYYGKSKI